VNQEIGRGHRTAKMAGAGPMDRFDDQSSGLDTDCLEVVPAQWQRAVRFTGV
jgi:hypothetical protein